MKHIPGLLVFLLLPLLVFAENNEPILGVFWSPDKDGKIEFYEKEGKIFGRSIWSSEPELKDLKNPDPSLRERLLLGSDCFLELELDGKEWEGQIYNGRDGKTYQCQIWLVDGGQTMKVRGFIGLPIFGQTVDFERIE